MNNPNPTIQRSLIPFSKITKNPFPRLKSKISHLSLSLLNLNGPHSLSPTISPSLSLYPISLFPPIPNPTSRIISFAPF